MRRQRNLLGPQGMGGMVSLWGASSLVKSVQYGTVSTTGVSGTSSITQVNTANAILVLLGQGQDDNSSSTPGDGLCRIALTNATTVTLTRGTANNTGTRTCVFAVIEFNPGLLRSVQYGAITIASGSSNTATVTGVNTAKSLLLHLGTDSTTYVAIINSMINTTLALTNVTTITLSMNANSAGLWTPIGGYVLVEFF